MNNLTVVIPSRTMSNLTPCIEAVRKMDDCDIVVVWDSSNGDVYQPQHNGCLVLEVKDRFIYARNCNLGIGLAGIGLRAVEHFAFVCVLIPRRTIETIGLLDERYCIDYGVEDRDYCEAVNRAGLKCGVYDHCYVDHASLTSSFRGNPRAPRSFAQNWNLFCQKWGMPA
jgi:hypothetical protein